MFWLVGHNWLSVFCIAMSHAPKNVVAVRMEMLEKFAWRMAMTATAVVPKSNVTLLLGLDKKGMASAYIIPKMSIKAMRTSG